jgi:hypothetical protein
MSQIDQRGEWESQSTTKLLAENLVLGGRYVSAPMLRHHQVSKKYFKGNYADIGGQVTVRAKLQRDLVVTLCCSSQGVFCVPNKSKF